MTRGRPGIVGVGVLAALVFAAPAEAQFKRCQKGERAQCAELRVPLDRAGQVKGTVKISALRLPARKGPRTGTVMLLPGGPGQGALEALLGSIELMVRLPTYDFVAFDPRGTGESSPLRCKALKTGRESTAPQRCARELGLRRGYYRSYDTVEDIEAVRAALGSPRLTLLSTSYGGRVAGEYVRRHPESVARQVMDSPVPVTGADPFGREAPAAQRRVLDTVRRGGARSVARLAARLARRPLRGRVVTAKGGSRRARLSQAGLYEALVGGDLDSILRGQLPSAAASAVRGDPAPLLRLTGAASSESEDDGVSVPVFLATTCSESALPWDTATPPTSARERQATAVLRRLGRAPFAPFSPLTVVGTTGLIGQCLAWPAVPKSPPLPPGSETSGVPTLVLQGQEDTRTPLEQSRGIAATYTGSRLLTVPYAGHAVLGSDSSGCSGDAAVAFLRGAAAPARCPARPRPLEDPVVSRFPRTLRSLRGSLRRRSINAGILTVSDVLLNFPAGQKAVGGLRGGRATARKRTIVLDDYEYLSGVRVTGTIRLKGEKVSGQVRIRGGGALTVRQTYRGAQVSTLFGTGRTASAASVTRWSPPPRRPALPPRLP